MYIYNCICTYCVYIMHFRALVAALFKEMHSLRTSMWRSRCTSSPQPTDLSHHPQHTALLAHHWLGFVCLFLFEYELMLLFLLLLGFLSPHPPMHKYSLLGVFFEQLSQALADGGACSLWGNAWREDVFDPEIYVLDSVCATSATRHPHCRCQAFPASHPYPPTSHCDKS